MSGLEFHWMGLAPARYIIDILHTTTCYLLKVYKQEVQQPMTLGSYQGK